MSQNGGMTTQQRSERVPVIPEFDLSDYLTKALRQSGLGVSEMAEQLGVTRETVGRWINGRGEPKRGALVAWAAITGVDLAWLETAPRARRDSNPKPSDWGLTATAGALDRSPRGGPSHAAPAVLTLVRGGLTPDRRTPAVATLHLVDAS